MIEPRRIGRYLTTDEHGFIVPDVSYKLIQEQWLPVIEAITQRLSHVDCITSIYIRGSIPRGLAQAGYSDIDFMCLTKHNEVSLKPLKQELEPIILQRYPFVRGLELVNITPEKLDKVLNYCTRPNAQMRIKTQSLFLAGKDISNDIAPFKPGLEMISHVFNLNKDLKTYYHWQEADPQDIQEDRRWLSRRIVRSGLEITLGQQTKFTRDLYLCYETFAKYYPEHANTMLEALENALNGRKEISHYKELITFLQTEAVKVFPPPTQPKPLAQSQNRT